MKIAIDKGKIDSPVYKSENSSTQFHDNKHASTTIQNNDTDYADFLEPKILIQPIQDIESLETKKTLFENITNGNNFNSVEQSKQSQQVYYFEKRSNTFNLPPIEKSFKTLDGAYLINVSSPDFFVMDAFSREIDNINARIWLVRITDLNTHKSYYGECCEYFWKPFVGLFLGGIDLKPSHRKITIKFSGGDEIDFDEVNNITLVEVKDYESTLFVE